MLKLPQLVEHYPSKKFSRALKEEIERCDKNLLPLEKGTTQGGYVSDEAITATVLRVSELAGNIQAEVGIFFTEIVICCGCGNDPTPVNAYCEMRFCINRHTGETGIDIIES